METNHPIGHEHHIPVAPRTVLENIKDRKTLKIKSVNVAIIKYFILPAPLRIPSATSLADTAK